MIVRQECEISLVEREVASKLVDQVDTFLIFDFVDIGLISAKIGAPSGKTRAMVTLKD